MTLNRRQLAYSVDTLISWGQKISCLNQLVAENQA
jgi:hypothetical protein